MVIDPCLQRKTLLHHGQTCELAFPFSVFATGCSRSSPDAEISAILGDRADLIGTEGGRAVNEEFDLGPILARGQTLRHEFTFINSTKWPIRLTDATVTTPCCTQIGTLSKEVIPPGGRCPIPVMFKAAPCVQPEKKRVGFLIQTDSTGGLKLRYELIAAVYPEWETRVLPESSRTLAIGQPGRQVIQITSRRLGGEGYTLPTRVEADSPLAVRFLTELRDQSDSESLTTQIRDVEVTLPASLNAENHRSSIRFTWPDGRTEQQPVVWEVVPFVRVSPSRLILKRSDRDVTHSVAIKAFDGRLFRVRHVGPPQVVVSAEFNHEASRAHILKLRIDPDRLSSEQDSNVIIQTDVEDQPTASLRITILPQGV